MTVTLADADFVLSATLVAFTVKVPAELGAVYSPEAETVPPLADQVTLVFALPVTVAVNCCVPAVCKDADVGLIVTETVGGAAVTVTVAIPDLDTSATLVAMIEYVPALAGAV